MQDFPSNSIKSRQRKEHKKTEGPPPEPRENIDRIVSGDVNRRRRGLGRQFKETFVEGTARGAYHYVITDVVVPNIKDLIFESFQAGMERWLFGESRIRRRSHPPVYSDTGIVNYQGMSSTTRSSVTGTRAISQQSRARHVFDEIVIPDRMEAHDVLDRMYDELSKYGRVTVAVLYALTGIQSSHIDHKWGWTNLRGSRVVTLGRGKGYLLDLPEPESFA